MSEKSHVSLETAICPVCGKQHQTGTILLDKRMKASMERETLTGYAMCEEHQKMKDDGYIALVGIDEKLSTADKAGTMTLQGAHRTGSLIHIRASVWGEFFVDAPVPPKGMCFVGEELIDQLKALAPDEESTEGEQE